MRFDQDKVTFFSRLKYTAIFLFLKSKLIIKSNLWHGMAFPITFGSPQSGN